jgi:hypothetical protein
VERLGDVAGVVLCPASASAADVASLRAVLERLFVHVHVAGEIGETVLEQLVETLETIREDRVVWALAGEAAPDAALLLALTAYVEDELVCPIGDVPTCAILKREPALAAARSCLSGGDDDIAGLEGRLSVCWIGLEDLAPLAAVRRLV